MNMTMNGVDIHYGGIAAQMIDDYNYEGKMTNC